jgi:hypothetical protein
METRAQSDLRNRPRQALTQHGGVRLATLFGPRATGRATPHGDLDLAAQSPGPLTAAGKLALIENLAQATGLPTGLIDLKHAGESLPGKILKHGVRLLRSDEGHAALLARHVFDAAGFLPCRNRIQAERRPAWISHQSNKRSRPWTTSIPR